MKTAILLLFASCAFAQTTHNGDLALTGTLNLMNATASAPTPVGLLSARPANCTAGHLYFVSDATAGQNLTGCTTTGTPGTWTLLGGSGGGAVSSVFTQVGAVPNLSGDISTTNSSVTAIGALKVTNAMLAGSITAAKLVGTDIATVGTVTAGVWNGTAVAATKGGTGLTAWTSGGVPYASSTTTIASSGLLAAGAALKGGGAGGAPTSQALVLGGVNNSSEDKSGTISYTAFTVNALTQEIALISGVPEKLALGPIALQEITSYVCSAITTLTVSAALSGGGATLVPALTLQRTALVNQIQDTPGLPTFTARLDTTTGTYTIVALFTAVGGNLATSGTTNCSAGLLGWSIGGVPRA